MNTPAKQIPPGPWEKFRDHDGFAICSGPDTVVCRGIQSEAVADLIVALPMVLYDMDVCYGECGSDYRFRDLSSETVEAINAARGES